MYCNNKTHEQQFIDICQKLETLFNFEELDEIMNEVDVKYFNFFIEELTKETEPYKLHEN
jgi:hypothetical protein